MKRLWIIALLTILVSGLSSLTPRLREALINGKVISFEESLPLEGVSIMVKGTKNGTGTQPDGTYTLAVKEGDAVLVVSLEEYETQELKIRRDQQVYDVVMKRK